jgi:pimeloyl-ACP methyl ester carboxylesterase
MRSRWHYVDGCKVHERYIDHPQTETPIVFVHGLVISSLYFIPLAECLASDFDVRLPDQPGFGRSEGPLPAPNVVEMASWLVRWLDEAGIDRCHLVANSLGCQIATAMALEAPHRVASATLIGPTVQPEARALWRQAVRIIWDAPHEPLQLWVNHACDQVRAGFRRVWQMIFNMLGDQIEERLPDVRQPVLIMRGQHDPSAPADWTQRVAELIPDSRLVTLPGWHCVHYSHPAETATVIRDFIQSVQRAGVTA